MKKILLISVLMLLTCNVLADNVVLDYYLVTSLTISKNKDGIIEYHCTQGGKTYQLTEQEYNILANGGTVNKG